MRLENQCENLRFFDALEDDVDKTTDEGKLRQFSLGEFYYFSNEFDKNLKQIQKKLFLNYLESWEVKTDIKKKVQKFSLEKKYQAIYLCGKP